MKLEHKRWGTFQIGIQNSASDSVDNVNLSQTNTITDAGVNSWNGDFILRDARTRGTAGLLSNGAGTFVRWGDYFDGNLLGGTMNGIHYISPIIHGFEASVAWGRDDVWDAGLRYEGEMAGFKIAAAIGYFVNRSEELNDTEPKEDKGWGGSIALLHTRSGLNLAYNYGTLSHTKNCEIRGEVSGKCRGDDMVHYVKGGLVQNFFPWGATAFYGEYYWQRKNSNESEEDVLRALEGTLDEALELRRTTGTMWGFGVVQKFNDDREDKNGKNGKNGKRGKNSDEEPDEAKKREAFAKKDETPIEIYLGYRHYELDVDLLGAAGAVSSKKISNFDVVLGGMKIRF